MRFLFWFSIFMIIYTYFGYALSLYILSIFRSRELTHDEDYCPDVTLIVTVHNEEMRIEEKIKNTLDLEYPAEHLEVIFASDASTDETDDIIRKHDKLELVRSKERKGKEYAQKLAVERARGNILIFSDVATFLQRDALQKIVANFADETVGCVSSEDRLIDIDGSIGGESAYVRYEMLLRRLESKASTVVGLSGSFFAARREVCDDWAVDLQSDFNTLLNSIKMGLRGVSDPYSIGYYRNIADEREEFNRKVRTVVRGISVFMRNLTLLNPFQYGLFSWQIFSHKLCRWLVPLFVILAFVSNGLLITTSFLLLFTFILQLTFYSLAFVYHRGASSSKTLYPIQTIAHQNAANGVYSARTPNRASGQTLNLHSTGHSTHRKRPFNTESSAKVLARIPYYFVLVNVSILIAWWEYLMGRRATVWEPSRR